MPGFVQRGAIGDGVIGPKQLSTRRMSRYLHDYFRQRPVAQLVGGGAAAGTTGAINQLNTGNPQGILYEYIILGAGQTIIVPTLSAAGLVYGLDLTNDEGVQYVFGAPGDGAARARLGYTIGTDPPFFMKGVFTFADASGTDAWYFGFRKQEALNADPLAFTDYATFAILTSAASALIQTSTRLNTGTASSVSTTQTWADAASKTFELRVSGGGAVTFLLNGFGPTITQAFTFDTGDLVVPYLHQLHAASTPGAATISELEVGFLS